MAGQSSYEPPNGFAALINELEETAIAVLLGLMTLITFVNVVLRYGFNASLIWGLEVTLILFAWLILFGVSYCVKVTAHLGVDALTNALPSKWQRICALASAAACLVYALLLLKGAWDYWAPFAALQPTTGRWIPQLFEEGLFTEGVRDRAFYITDQVPMLEMVRWLEPLINYDEEYEKLPRVIPYTMLPVGAALLLFRLGQASRDIWIGRRASLIVSHEVEDALEEIAAERER